MLAPGGGSHNGSPLDFIFFGLLLSVIGAARLYCRVLQVRRDSGSLSKIGHDQSLLRQLGASGVTSIGIILGGIFAGVIGIIQAVK